MPRLRADLSRKKNRKPMGDQTEKRYCPYCGECLDEPRPAPKKESKWANLIRRRLGHLTNLGVEVTVEDKWCDVAKKIEKHSCRRNQGDDGDTFFEE